MAAAAAGLQAQVPGDTMEAVEAKLGRPQMSRRTGDREIWVYRDHSRVTFDHGVVVDDPDHPLPAARADAGALPPPASAPASRQALTTPEAANVQPVAKAAESAHPTADAERAGGPRLVYNDEARHLRFSLPPGFERVPSADRTIFALWLRQPTQTQGLRLVGLAELPIPEKIPRGPIPANKLPPGTTLTLVPWRGEMLNVGRVEEKLPDRVLVNFNLLLPQRGKILRLTFAGPVEEEKDVRALLDATLPTLEVPLEFGPTASDQSAYKLGQLTGIVAIVALAVVAVRWARKKKAGKEAAPPLLKKN